MDKIKSPETDEFFEAVLNLKSIKECYAFFDDVCTINELKSITQRFHVARLLYEGSTYTDIIDKTGASTTTISRVNKALLYGSDGYKAALEKLKINQ